MHIKFIKLTPKFITSVQNYGKHVLADMAKSCSCHSDICQQLGADIKASKAKGDYKSFHLQYENILKIWQNNPDNFESVIEALGKIIKACDWYVDSYEQDKLTHWPSKYRAQWISFLKNYTQQDLERWKNMENKTNTFHEQPTKRNSPNRENTCDVLPGNISEQDWRNAEDWVKSLAHSQNNENQFFNSLSQTITRFLGILNSLGLKSSDFHRLLSADNVVKLRDSAQISNFSRDSYRPFVSSLNAAIENLKNKIECPRVIQLSQNLVTNLTGGLNVFSERHKVERQSQKISKKNGALISACQKLNSSKSISSSEIVAYLENVFAIVSSHLDNEEVAAIREEFNRLIAKYGSFGEIPEPERRNFIASLRDFISSFGTFSCFSQDEQACLRNAVEIVSRHVKS